ncbi:NifU family protein [Williamsia deligens]|uniref:NifU family protein n=1 Tax=Williamsia deligens TaxID=321325 RepID=A0ABW3G676_9NOCA|nr:NifU family protein [Williamsia deligens]MCP2194124.1 Fe-S cluster biogenesis protein NfuA, 4Fe-4S-binding domain [Williamsia deligens]
MSAAGVPVHPEAVADRPDTVRWIVPAGSLPFVGPLGVAPPQLAALIDAAVVSSVVVEPAAVLVTLTPGHTWRSEGTRIRAALSADLADPSAWGPAQDSTPDDVLRAAAEAVLAGDVGAFIATHGGALTVVDASDGVITVALDGACSHCPAADVTLTDRFAEAVRARAPFLREVRTADAAPARPRLLRLLPTRS